jgi:hypothetical protein
VTILCIIRLFVLASSGRAPQGDAARTQCHTAACLLTDLSFQNSVLRGASVAATSQVRDVLVTLAGHGWI